MLCIYAALKSNCRINRSKSQIFNGSFSAEKAFTIKNNIALCSFKVNAWIIASGRAIRRGDLRTLNLEYARIIY